MALHKRSKSATPLRTPHPGGTLREKTERPRPAHPRQRHSPPKSLHPGVIPAKSLFDERDYQSPERWDGLS